MTKVTSREMIVSGRCHVAEFAVDERFASPGKEFMSDLQQGVLDDDPDATSRPSDEQVADYDKLCSKIKFMVRNGEPERRLDVNYLDEGVWEFKAANKRIAFYDTDGDGTWTPKPKIKDRQEADWPESDFWWFPNMDETLRLLNGWVKRGDLADPADIAEAIRIAREDVRHDEPE